MRRRFLRLIRRTKLIRLSLGGPAGTWLGRSSQKRPALRDTWSSRPFVVAAVTGPPATNRLELRETWSGRPFVVAAVTGPPGLAKAPPRGAFLSTGLGPGRPAAPGTGTAPPPEGADRARAAASLGSRHVLALAAHRRSRRKNDQCPALATKAWEWCRIFQPDTDFARRCPLRGPSALGCAWRCRAVSHITGVVM